MKELIPIGVVLLYDILIAIVVITLKDIDWRKKGTNPDLDKIIAFVFIHLIFLLGIYSISRTGSIAWFDNHAWGNSGLRTSFVVLNMMIFPIFIWFKEKADPTIDWKLLRNIAMAGWLVPMVLCFFPIGCNSKSDDAVGGTVEYSITQPEGFPLEQNVPEGNGIIPVKQGWDYGAWIISGKGEITKDEKGNFHYKAGPGGMRIMVKAICQHAHDGRTYEYHDPEWCPLLQK